MESSAILIRMPRAEARGGFTFPGKRRRGARADPWSFKGFLKILEGAWEGRATIILIDHCYPFALYKKSANLKVEGSRALPTRLKQSNPPATGPITAGQEAGSCLSSLLSKTINLSKAKIRNTPLLRLN